ncbi:MBL fold metallo-hydrolase [Oceanobacillus sp. CAU 1775]
MKNIKLFLFISMLFLLTACGTVENTEESTTEEDITVEDVTADAETESTEPEESSVEEKAEQETVEEQAPKSSGKLGELNVHFIDVGQADATLFAYSDGENNYNILFDTGDWRGSQVVSYLNANQITNLDLVVVSHPDADHIGQLDKVMQNIAVDEVWMSGNESTSQTFQRAVESVVNSDAGYHEPRAGESFDIGPMEIEVLYPNGISGNSNEESIAMLFTYGSVKFLLTGDADKNGESYMHNNFNVAADVLHLGHHGSNTSSDTAFVDAVAPEIAVYSAGANNSYGHPNAEVVNTILDRNIKLYGTDEHGTIIISSDGKTVQNVTTTGKSEPIKQTQAKAPAKTENKAEPKATEQKEKKPELKPSSGCININQASFDEVQGIIHIGPARAEELIQIRPFDSVDNLSRIKGIGPARIADIKAEGKACVQ